MGFRYKPTYLCSQLFNETSFLGTDQIIVSNDHQLPAHQIEQDAIHHGDRNIGWFYFRHGGRTVENTGAYFTALDRTPFRFQVLLSYLPYPWLTDHSIDRTIFFWRTV